MIVRLVVSLALICLTAPAGAQERFSLLRDDEIEKTLSQLITLFDQTQQKVRVLVVDDPTMNAFVVDRHTIYVHSGLIAQVEDVGAIVAILAHERGHQSSGHFLALEQKNRHVNSRLVSMLALSAALLSQGFPEATGIVPLAVGSAMSSFSNEVRIMEMVADQWMIDAMRNAKLDMVPYAEFIARQARGDIQPSLYHDRYTKTHPLWSERLQSIRLAIENDAHKAIPAPIELRYALIRAKLTGWLEESPIDKLHFPDRLKERTIAAFYNAARRGDRSAAQARYGEIRALAGQWPQSSLDHVEIQWLKMSGDNRKLYQRLGALIGKDDDLIELRLLYAETALKLHAGDTAGSYLLDLYEVLDNAYASGYATLPHLFWLMGKLANAKGDQPQEKLARSWLLFFSGNVRRSEALLAQVPLARLTLQQSRAFRDLRQLLES